LAPPALANPRVEIATAPLALSPQTHYQVLSRVAVCPGEGGFRVACLQEEYVELGDFTTGTESDRQGPTIASVDQGASPGECLLALSVVASDDHAPLSALRFGINDALLGPDLVLLMPGSAVPTTLPLVPIDPSNNRGPALQIDVDACTPLVIYGGSDYGFPASALPVQRRPVAASQDGGGGSGCAVVPGSASGAVGVGIALFSVLTVLAAARRRNAG
jgi:hypothetical protein